MTWETEREGGRGKREGALPFASRFARILRRVIGAPDYEAYLEHCRIAGHSSCLSEGEYMQEFFESKSKGVRCC